MFGYVRPCAQELKVKEFERFRACYCGLCHELGRAYGLAGRSILNYDFVFLAMLLWNGEENCRYCFRRCLPGLFRKKCVCAEASPLTAAAGYSVILAYWKAADDLADSRGMKHLAAGISRMWLGRAYKKASAAHPEFDGSVRLCLGELGRLEAERAKSLDRPADTFARLLSSASDGAEESSKRAMSQLLYHVGRIIYICDAWNDLEEDFKTGDYNPVAARYGLTGHTPPEEVRESVRQTLNASVNLASSAFELLPRNYWRPVTENMIYLGIPQMINDVLAGTYSPAGRKAPTRPSFGQNGE